MLDSDDQRNPFTDDEGDQDTISRLVAGAVQTHRKPQEESTRKRPRYPSEEDRSKITLDLDPDTIAAMREIARREGVGRYVSKVAQALLDYALEAYELGHIRLELRPAVIGRRLEAIGNNDSEI